MATLKTCFKCNAVKPIAEFYKHPQMGDGRLGKCKECAKRDAWLNRQSTIEEKRAYDRDRAQLPHRVLLRRRCSSAWAAKFPERKQAQAQLWRAVKHGVIQKLPCWVCGAEAEAHHPDYSMPLEVVWLCPTHHKQAHAIASTTWNSIIERKPGAEHLVRFTEEAKP